MVAPQRRSDDSDRIPLQALADHSRQSVDNHNVASEESDPLDEPLKQSALTTFRSATDRLWAWEILSCCLSAGALIAIIATLSVHNGRPLPQWPHLITINSLIATFTTIFKASMMMPIAEGISELKWSWFQKSRYLKDLDTMDTASRGPWGSFLLLLGMKPYFLAGLGAVITIVALAVDPFSQQIIQYYNCLQPVPGLWATVPMTNSYTGYNAHVGAGIFELDPVMALAVYTGLMDPPANNSVSIPVDCPTGNCTFPHDNGATFSSLGVCHACRDISDQITNITFLDQGRTQNNMTLPSGATLRDGDYIDAVNSIGSYDEGDPLTLYSFDALIASRKGYLGARCSVYPCVTTYGSNVTESVYIETRIRSIKHDLLTKWWDGLQSWSLATNRTLRNGTWHDCNPSPNRTDMNILQITQDRTIAISGYNYTDIVWYPSDCVYYMNTNAVSAFKRFLAGIWGQERLSRVYQSAWNVTTGPLWLQGLYRDGEANMTTVNEYMEGLTTSLSAAIRTNGNTPSSDYIKGTVMASQTCIRVRWVWISLPASLYALTVVFLTLTVLQTKHQKWNGHWKSSAVALLLHGIDSETRRELGATYDKGRMCETAENVTVHLQYEDGGWSFVRNR